MARKRPDHTPVHRTDTLASNMTAVKENALHALMDAWRDTAVALGAEQWRLFFETGKFNKNHDVDKVTYAALIGSAARVQMCRYTVVGQLKGWLSNRANDFRRVVSGSSLPPDVRRMLYTINLRKSWFDRSPQRLLAGLLPKRALDTEGNTLPADHASLFIPNDVRKLARTIMRAVMTKHRRPNLAFVSMVLDARGGELRLPEKATQKGAVEYWIHLSTMEKGGTIDIPLLGYAFHRNREGIRSKGVQVNRNRDGVFTFGVVTDIGKACEASRAAYAVEVETLKTLNRARMGTSVWTNAPVTTEAIALDFGLATLFGTSQGQLLGRGWLARLKRYDARITDIARGVQRRGGKLRDNARYRNAVQDMRGFLTTEIHRVLNRLVAERKPMELVVEHLDFRNPTLSRRLNRLLSNCGRSVLATKLADLKARYGITSTEVNPAYTSQTCSRPGCGYVDARNRTSQGVFRCLWCGHTLQADLNAAANIEARRACPNGWLFQSKAETLAGLVRAFSKRKVRSVRGGVFLSPPPNGARRPRGRDPADDPRTSNPYFSAKEKTEKRTRVSEMDKTPQAQSAALVVPSQ